MDSDGSSVAGGDSSSPDEPTKAADPVESALRSPDGERGPESGAVLGRFRLGELLGEGGMGRVYASFDPQLQRPVAIKLLSRGGEEAVRRFTREAHAQAGVSHPNVCPIFEVGESDDRLYIVMARLEGQPLDRADVHLGLEATLVLVRTIAEAVHAAHRTGLVHRDLKPGNVLIEARDGGLHPYVLDFGLARPTLDADLTQEGEAIGTPSYMAPEQALGEVGRIDRRTDVYALGATLYRLLAGRPPFPGKGPTTLMRVLYEEAPSLREHGVPADVEAIVFKCLEKDPEERYASAKALAEDLGRYLDGEPVLARPADTWYRLRKWLQRNRRVAAISLVAATLLALSLAWGTWTWWRAGQREAVVRELTEKVEQVEALARYSHLSPRHDVGEDRLLIRRSMEQIRRRMEESGKVGRAAGHYALGRGLLALEELDAALHHLETAWQGGLRSGEVASSLARCLSAIYRRDLLEAELVRDWQTRQEKLAELEERYGDRVGELLEGQSLGEQTFLAALGPFHEGRFEEALSRLERPRRPWAFELAELEGDIRRSWAVALAAEDELDAARRQFDLAEAAYREAVRIAPSAPGLYRSLAQLAFQRVSLDGSSGADLSPLLASGLEAAGLAIEVDPTAGEAWLFKARLHRAAAREEQNRGGDPSAELEHAIAAATEAAARLDDPSPAWRELGRSRAGQARYASVSGADPLPAIQLATEALARVENPSRDYEFWIFLGQVESTRADALTARGNDAAPPLERAVTAYEKAVERHSEPFAALLNLGLCLLKLADQPESEKVARLEPAGALDRAEAAFTAAAELRPEHVAPRFYIGRALLRRAREGSDERPFDDRLAEQALEHFRAAAEIAPGMFQVHIGRWSAAKFLAISAWDQGRDPASWLERARLAAGRAHELAPSHPASSVNQAWTEFFAAKLTLRSGGDPAPLIRAGLGMIEEALELSRSSDSLLCLGSLYRIRAEHETRRAMDAGESIERSRSAFEELLRSNPSSGEAHRSLARLETLDMERLAALGEDARPAFVRAMKAIERAAGLGVTPASTALARARLTLAADELGLLDENRGEAFERSLTDLRQARARWPGWPEVRVVEAALRLRNGEKGATPDLRRALEENPNLRAEWARWLNEAAPDRALRDR